MGWYYKSPVFSTSIGYQEENHEMKIISFWFQTMNNDWVWRKVFERCITILNVSVDIIQVLFFQVSSKFEKLRSKFKRFFIEELKIPEQHLNKVYAPIYS